MINGGIVGGHYGNRNSVRGPTKVFFRAGQTQHVVSSLSASHQLGSGRRVIPWNTVPNEIHHNGHLFSVRFPVGTNADLGATVAGAFFQPDIGTYDIFIEGITSAHIDRHLTLRLCEVQPETDDVVLFIDTIPGNEQSSDASTPGNTFFGIRKNLVVQMGDIYYFSLDDFANNVQSRVTAAMTIEKTA